MIFPALFVVQRHDELLHIVERREDIGVPGKREKRELRLGAGQPMLYRRVLVVHVVRDGCVDLQLVEYLLHNTGRPRGVSFRHGDAVAARYATPLRRERAIFAPRKDLRRANPVAVRCLASRRAIAAKERQDLRLVQTLPVFSRCIAVLQLDRGR